jgi:hypothetical protein
VNHELANEEKKGPDLKLGLPRAVRAWIRRKLGPRWVLWIGALVAFLPFVITYGPKVYEFGSRGYENYRKNHPNPPRFAPDEFVVGLDVSGTRGATNLAEELQLAFWHHASVKIELVDMPEKPRGVSDMEYSVWRQDHIKNWITKSGAQGVASADMFQTPSSNFICIMWTGPELSDQRNYHYERWVNSDTLYFPPLASSDARDLLSLWLKVKATEFYTQQSEVDIQLRPLSITDSERRTFQRLCSQFTGGPTDLGTKRFSRIKLAILLANQSQYPNKNSTNAQGQPEFFDDFLNATGHHFNQPFPLTTPEDFASLFLGFDLCEVLAEHVEDADQSRFYLINAASLLPKSDDEVGIAVERFYPFCKESIKAAGAIIETLQVQNLEDSQGVIQTNRMLDELVKSVDEYEDALSSIQRKGNRDQYVQGRWQSELGLLLGYSAMVFADAGRDAMPLWRRCAKHFRLATEDLRPFQKRTPHLLSVTYKDLSRALLMIGSNSVPDLRESLVAAQQARSVAVDCNSAVLEEDATVRIVAALSALGNLTDNKELLNQAYQTFNNFPRIRGRTFTRIVFDQDAGPGAKFRYERYFDRLRELTNNFPTNAFPH